MDDQLRTLLAELADAIGRSQADGEIDDAERDELRSLLERAERALAEPDAGGADGEESVLDGLEVAAVRFEGRHPTLAAAIRSAVDTLSGYGI